MNTFNVEVAVCFTDGTWESTFTTVEDFQEEEAERVAEDKVLDDFSAHPTKVVSFVKTIYIEDHE